MKKMGFLALLLFLLASGGCKKEKDLDNDDDDIVGSPVTVIGQINAQATEAVTVLALSTTNSYKQADVTNNAFSLPLDNGKPWGLIFLNSASQPIGYLSLGNGIDALPLQCTSAGIDTIDLQTITRNGAVFTPTHNPIGNEILLSAQQLQVVAAMDDYLAATLKSPDVNGNGQVDALEGKSFSLSVIYFIKPGVFTAGGLAPTLDTTKYIEGFRLFLSVKDQSFPETVYFTGPAGSQLSGSASEERMQHGNHSVYNTPYIFDLMGTGNFIPPGGVYTVQYGGSTLTFTLPDQSYVVSNVVFPYPTLTLNGNGTINKLDWSYHYGSGTANFDLSALMKNLQIQIEGTGNKCGSDGDPSRLYNSDRLTISTVTHTLSCQNIIWGVGTNPYPGWEHIDRVMMTYEDHYKTAYVVMYERTY